MPTYLSGIQPTGLPHLGNFFGAIAQHIALQAQGGEHFYFIADLHALTTTPEPAELRQRVTEVVATYLALGLDPERVALFRQSDVPEVCEIAWLLACMAPMGLLERAVSYKDKIARGLSANVGLFTYPALMAADILAYDSHQVPVGVDQVQHVEIARDLAEAFNRRYGEVFVLPQALLSQRPKVPGLDGEKMSKSYGNTIWVFESGKPLRKAIARITTDSRPPEDPKDPAGLLLFRFLELFLEPGELEAWGARVRAGGPGAPGYGHLKQLLVDSIERRFAPARQMRAELLADPARIESVLRAGAAKARPRAVATRDRAYRACGIR